MQKLQEILRTYGRVLVAYSGGVDSTFLLAVARKILGKDHVLAVTAVSETYPASEFAQARRLSKKLDVRHCILKTRELNNRKFRANPLIRCYYCKDELFGKLAVLAKKEKMVLIDATNFSDRTDYRPGRKAAAKWRVASPLLAAGMTKDDIRSLSRQRRLPTWNQPAQACLASRFPYGTPLSKGELRRVEKGEEILRKLGLHTFRLRNHGDTARIEMEKSELRPFFARSRYTRAAAQLKTLGWRYITVDLEGYRTGSLNP